MAQLPASTSRKFNPADYKTAEEWFKGRFLSQLNLFTDPVYTALQNGLTFKQNFNAQYFSQILTAGATADLNAFSFKSSISGIPSEIVIASCNFAADPTIPLLSAVSISWYADAGTNHITAVSGLTAGSVYKIVLRIS
jgi:hypothetical protein